MFKSTYECTSANWESLGKFPTSRNDSYRKLNIFELFNNL